MIEERSNIKALPRAVSCVVDGGAKPNPGHGATGVVYLDSRGHAIGLKSSYLGEYTSNNVAEFAAILDASATALQYGVKELRIETDSQLAYHVWTGEAEAQNSYLRELMKQIRFHGAQFARFELRWNPRANVAKAHEAVSRTLSTKPKLSPRWGATRRVTLDAQDYCSGLGWQTQPLSALGLLRAYPRIAETGRARGKATIAAVGFYSARAGVLCPSVDLGTYYEATHSVRPLVWAWRPYGSFSVPCHSGRVGLGYRDGPDGGQQLLFAGVAQLGASIGKVGYNGKEVHYLEVDEWFTDLEQALQRAKAGNRKAKP